MPIDVQIKTPPSDWKPVVLEVTLANRGEAQALLHACVKNGGSHLAFLTQTLEALLGIR